MINLKQYLVFFLLLAIIAILFVYWYFYLSNRVGFLYSTKNISYNFLKDYHGELHLIEYNEEGRHEKIIRSLKSKGINIIIGPMFSEDGKKLLPFLEKYDLVAFSPTITSKRLLASTNRIFSLVPDNDYLIDTIENFLRSKNVKNVLIILDPRNKAYSNEFVKIIENFKGDYWYYYGLNTLFSHSKDWNKYDAIVITTTSKEAIDIIIQISSIYKGLFVLTDSALDMELTKYNGPKEKIYLISFTDNPFNYVADLIEEAIDLVASHKFLSANQVISFYLQNNFVDGKRFNYIGTLQRKIKVLNFSEIKVGNE
ncbi:type 1 periplasmic-binding domain-containing protein [Thermosipho atlanticus]|uniref:Amino acid/amide ABC transporter substrate-binding protein, HAAT family n=1 Tax=Thermosipho atlanticus DSM 15807 TaxID=1123380 RepID=A0A1M5R9U2_9BACT|nr:ABC transporter substrate-binding protein [Thermosipho atlanticus]SHH23011.1 amino acid/amide ABC transporter substrate-binding protein, HAAT family [Thermosipho atlanticus DSM 15807]